MKLRPMLFIIVAIALLVAACGTKATPSAVAPTQPPSPVPPTATAMPTATAVPTSTTIPSSTPTEAPKGSGDPTWDRIESASKIVIGTSADYKPFEYYDSNGQIVGFDAAIARELGARLGIQVELRDYAFEGLVSAVQHGEVDAAIAAISVTSERQAVVDFTDVYYTGQDAVLARQGSGIAKIVSPVQLVQYRVGVQRGSTYEKWLQTNMIDTGLMSAANLLQYNKPEEAVRDLKENRNDLVVMGNIPAQEYLLSGGLELVGQGLNNQLFAIALPKGSSVLKARLNDTLTQMRNDGRLARFANDYLQVDLSQIPQLPTPPPSVVIPTPGPCYDSMKYVADVTVPDGTFMSPGEDFDKIWRIRNTGTCAWDSTYRIVYVQGYLMEGGPQAVRGVVKPGDTYDMVIDQRAPGSPGSYKGWWQMVNGNNDAFGPRIWVNINVPGNPEPTRIPPTATPVPPRPIQPTIAPGSVIDYLNVSADSVQQGAILVVSWSFSGTGLASARLTRTNPDGTLSVLNSGADINPQGQYEDLMMNPGPYSYTLTVTAEFGGTSVQTVVVNVTSN